MTNLFYAKFVRLLKEKGMTVAAAESCTGGMISKMITDIPGSSDVFGLGVVSYSEEKKISALGVSAQTIEKYGVYSEETASEMAKCARKLASSNIAVATSGIAGPDGGTDELPVGTVFIAVDGEHGTVVEKCSLLPRSRRVVRILAAQRAAQMCAEYLRGSEQ